MKVQSIVFSNAPSFSFESIAGEPDAIHIDNPGRVSIYFTEDFHIQAQQYAAARMQLNETLRLW